MAQIDITRNYNNGEALTEADLDSVRTSITTFVNSTLLNDDNFQTNSITASTKFVDSSVTTAVIADEAITSAKIDVDGVTTGKIADANVTTAKIADSNVTTAKIADLNVTNAKVADSNVTKVKRAAAGQQVSVNASGTTSSTSDTDVTDLNVTITTTGKSVMLYLTKDTTAAQAGLQAGSDVDGYSTFKLFRDATPVAAFRLGTFQSNNSSTNNTFQWPATAICYIDSPAAGTYTYKATMANTTSSAVNVGLQNVKLVAYEIV